MEIKQLYCNYCQYIYLYTVHWYCTSTEQHPILMDKLYYTGLYWTKFYVIWKVAILVTRIKQMVGVFS